MDKETRRLVLIERLVARKRIRELEKEGWNPEEAEIHRSLIEELVREGDLERLRQIKKTLELTGRKRIKPESKR